MSVRSKPLLKLFKAIKMQKCITAPVSGYIGDRFSRRKLTLILTPVAASGLIVAAVAPTWQITILGYGVIFGMSF